MAIAPLAAQQATEPSRTLTPGPGSALTMAKCSICHDITHVTRSLLTRDEWDDNIKVMIQRGMPIEPHEISIIVDYLATYYNRDKAPPAAEPSAEKASSQPAPVARLLSDHGCVACHATDKKVVGPSFREVAGRYRADPGVAEKLAAKIRRGGAGTWGPVPMPPHPQIAEADLKRIADWVLTQ